MPGSAAGGELLDLGCGSGELARRLAAGGYRVTGCDIAPRMLRQAAAADGGHTVRWIRLEPGWRKLPFAAASLDAVVAASVLEYVHDPRPCSRECARVLRPGGSCCAPCPTWPTRCAGWNGRSPGRGTDAAGPVRARAPGRGSGQYLAYLRDLPPAAASSLVAHGGQAGRAASPLPARGRRAPRAPLRLLAFTRPGACPGHQAETQGNDERRR